LADIFISYSTHDRHHALTLVERLRADGHSVWIDQQGIGAATSWSNEIADALDNCKAFILLMSETSLASKNVMKELALAAEADKYIIPVELESVTIPTAFKYHLAGLQRTSINNIDAILQSLEKYRSSDNPSEPSRPSVSRGSEQDAGTTIRIAVLPFEDQSPARDNEWFADGLADELILMLNKLDALFVMDKKSAMVYRDANLSTKQIAGELGVRYIITGGVRKAGDKIRVQATLIDTSNGATLWTDKFTGTMDDIFEIQEKTAFDICEGLKLKLTPEEEMLLEEKLTTSGEVYELYMQARIHCNVDRNWDAAEKLIQSIMEIDPKFIPAYYLHSIISSNRYSTAQIKNKEDLEKAKECIIKITELDPNSYFLYSPKANYYLHIGEKELALEMAKKAVESQPKRWSSYAVLAFIYTRTGYSKEAIKAFLKCLELDPTVLPYYEYLLDECYKIGDYQTIENVWQRAQREFEARIALYPNDMAIYSMYLWCARLAGKRDIALSLVDRLLTIPDLTSTTYYRIACAYTMTDDIEKTRKYLRKAIDLGDVNFTKKDITWFITLKDTSEYQHILDNQDTDQ
jgi:TolB-like protein